MEKLECLLPADLNHCPFFLLKDCSCRREEKCTYQAVPEAVKRIYIRKERWYKKYYRRRNR